jgi:hypothetical protein
MNRHFGVTVATIAGLLSISGPQVYGASDPTNNLDVSVIKGDVQSRTGSSSSWSTADPSIRADGAWVRTGRASEAVVTLPNQMRLRMEQSTCLRVRSMGYGILELDVNTGKAFASIPADATDKLVVYGPGAKVQASSGDFLIDVTGSQPRIDVVDGDATIQGVGKSAKKVGPHLRAVGASHVTGEVALDGPDVRSRKQEADEFNDKNKKKKKKKGAGYVEAPANPAPPAPPPDSPPPPPPEPPAPPPPADVPPPPVAAAAAGGGSATGFYIAGIAALGIGLGFGLSGHHNDNTTPIPVSP